MILLRPPFDVCLWALDGHRRWMVKRPLPREERTSTLQGNF
jgi:hypothetical protein